MHPVEAMMRGWLASGTETQKAHAAARLKLPFEPDPDPAPASFPPPTRAIEGAATPSPVPAEPWRPPAMLAPGVPLSEARPWVARVNLCLYRDCAVGCQRSRCHWKRRDVALAGCVGCLSPGSGRSS